MGDLSQTFHVVPIQRIFVESSAQGLTIHSELSPSALDRRSGHRMLVAEAETVKMEREALDRLQGWSFFFI